MSLGVAPTKGGCPQSRIYKIIPQDHTSSFSLYFFL